MKKIEKLESSYDVPQLKQKLNEIIDHLNSQDQEGWKEVNKDIWYMVGGKKYVNINGEEYVRTSDIEKLLSKLTTK